MVWYRLLISICAPFLLFMQVWWILTGRGDFSDLSQRLGEGHGEHRAFWLHGASNGELNSARGLLEAFLRDYPGHPVIVTANTATGRDLVTNWGLSGVTARLAPIDLRWAVARFNRHWRPVALVSLENELWPNRFVASNCPILCIAARMSQRSAMRWKRFPGVCLALFGRVSRLFPQDDVSAARFISLGLAPERVGPAIDIKSSVTLPSPDTVAFASLKEVFPRHSTILAASTHQGEEAIVLEAFLLAYAANPDLKLILAPRHPSRGAEVTGLVEAAGLRYSVRSKSRDPEADITVYIADTLAEMQLWYALAGTTFVGGSLVRKGGHTPYEPTQLDSAILHGPHIGNFASIYAALDAASGALEVMDAESLASGIAALDADERIAQARRAAATLKKLDTSEQDIQTVMDALKQVLED